MKRIIWVLGLCLWGWGCTDRTNAEALLPKPPVLKLEAVVDSSGERRLVAIHPEKDSQFVVTVLSPSSVVKTLKKRFPKDTTFQTLQVLQRENTRWVFFQAFDARSRVDHYWDIDKNELYSRSFPLAGGKRSSSKNVTDKLAISKLIDEREAEEEGRLRERVVACVKDHPALKDERQPLMDVVREPARLQVDGQTVLVGLLSTQPTRIALCRTDGLASTQLVGLLPLEEECLDYGFSESIWFSDVAPTEGSELLAEVTSNWCGGMKGSQTKLAVYSLPLDGTKTRQILFEEMRHYLIGLDGSFEKTTGFKFTGPSGGYTAIATTIDEERWYGVNSGRENSTSRSKRTYVWSKSKDRFVKRGE